jgi:chaperonin GroES
VAGYEFLTTWLLDAPREPIWDAIYAQERWPEWWRGVEEVEELDGGDGNRVGAVSRMVWRSFLPYRVEFHVKTTKVERPLLLEADAVGELHGVGRVERRDDEVLDEPDGAGGAADLRVESRLGDASRRRGNRGSARLPAACRRLSAEYWLTAETRYLSLVDSFGTLIHRVPRPVATSDRTNGGTRMKLKPLGDRLIVKPIEEEETTASGIVLPDTAKEKPQKGKVVAVGDGAINEDGSRRPLDVSDGDEVLYSKYGGTEVTVEDEELLVLRESDVLAKVG